MLSHFKALSLVYEKTKFNRAIICEVIGEQPRVASIIRD